MGTAFSFLLIMSSGELYRYRVSSDDLLHVPLLGINTVCVIVTMLAYSKMGAGRYVVDFT